MKQELDALAPLFKSLVDILKVKSEIASGLLKICGNWMVSRGLLSKYMVQLCLGGVLSVCWVCKVLYQLCQYKNYTITILCFLVW